uniref:myosin heavy chain, striated muscle-like isoform X2 n=1 Tax=Ciona intestinalis TaxID=7719 RepID=UPI000180BBD9|nr:myosin heavy chain, striated muscle-like isoform X2 [Ciona intestinalis]|eukprot:XP_018668851.1 myosin heavy chain, striated muscle-like isoform X2 [Ciona intestinalis]
MPKSFHEQVITTEIENDGIIQALRAQNQALRHQLQHALNKDHQSIERLFVNRPKNESLALRRRSVQEVKEELNQSLCALKRSANKLVDAKRKKTRELEKLKQTMNTPLANIKDEYSSRARQVENSLDKVKLKAVTAQNIMNVYMKVKNQLEDQLRMYPNKLKLLEKEKSELDQELVAMNVVHENAATEVEVALKDKSLLENNVRQERKERELTLRQLRRDVKNIERKIEEQQLYLHNLSLSRKLTRVDSAQVQKVANLA